MGDSELLQALPLKWRKDLERVCAETGYKPVALVREIVALYKVRGNAAGVKVDLTQFSKEFCDAVLTVAASIRGHRTSSNMTEVQKKKRAQDGAAARNENLTPEARKKIAQDAARVRWKKQTKSE